MDINMRYCTALCIVSFLSFFQTIYQDATHHNMAHLLLLVTVTLFYWRLISASPIQSDAVRQRYNVERQSLLDDNNQRRFGDSLVLDHNEKTLDDIIINVSYF